MTRLEKFKDNHKLPYSIGRNIIFYSTMAVFMVGIFFAIPIVLNFVATHITTKQGFYIFIFLAVVFFSIVSALIELEYPKYDTRKVNKKC